jgi:DNA polymerase III delta subunit
VSSFVAPSREEKAWNIQFSLLTGGSDEAVQHLRYVLDVSREAPQFVIWVMVDLARKLHAASRALHQGTPSGNISRTLKLWGPSGDALLSAARSVNPQAALRLLRECVAGDMRSKSGFGDLERTLERLAVRFTQLLRRQTTEARR